MSDVFLSGPTVHRTPHPRGRRIKIGAALSGLESNCAQDITGTGPTGTSVSTMGQWGNLNSTTLTSLGYLDQGVAGGPCENAVILTENAPLTKGYGDSQLADVNDLTVYVDGSEVTPLFVDAPAGVILLEQQLATNTEVSVEYHYTPNPTLNFNALNNASYLLNQWARPHHHPFTFNTVLGPSKRRQPKQYEYRYRAFDHAYTSSLNDPTTMLLNEPKHGLTLNPFSRTITPEPVFFEGDDHPQGWEYTGAPLGAPVINSDQMYVIDDSSPSMDVVTGQPAVFEKTYDLTYEHLSILNARMRVDSYSKVGDFSGVAFGYADERKLYMVGFLEVDGTRFVGLLKDPRDESRWQSYTGLQATSVERSTGSGTRTDVLETAKQPPVMPGQRVLVGGTTYEVGGINENSAAGVWETTLTEELPSTGPVTYYPEQDWSQTQTYRLFKGKQNKLNLLVGGSVIPVAVLDTSEAAIAVEVFEVLQNNRLFFGSVSRQATSQSSWDFVRYSFLPTSNVGQSSRISVDAEFNTLPEKDPHKPWYLSDNQGYHKIFANEFLLTQSGSQRFVGGGYNFSRVEPFLTSDAIVDLNTSLRVHSYATGTPATITVADEDKELTIGLFDGGSSFTTASTTSLLTKGFGGKAATVSLESRGYITGYGEVPVDGFLSSFSGVQTFDDAGWDDSLDTTELSFRDHFMRVDHDSGAAQAFEVSERAGSFTNHVASARFRFGEYTPASNNQVPVYFGVSDGNEQVYLTFFDDGTQRRLVFCDENGSIVFSSGQPLGLDFDFADGEFHHFKLARYGANVTVFVDGEYQDVFDISDLPDDPNPPGVVEQDAETRFGLLSEHVSVDIDYLFAHAANHQSRMLGIFTGDDLLDPDSYDKVPVEWFGTFVDIRVRRDPAGKTQVFLNDDSSPAFELQYSELPDRQERYNLETGHGYVQFGTLDPQAYSEVLWDYVRYDVINQRDNQLANNNSFLNRHNVISSPEPITDESPESVYVESDGKHTIELSKTGMYASSVLAVTSVDGLTTYPFTYDFQSNTLGIIGAGLPSGNETVQVTFYHRTPFTESYLQNNHAFTQLNEDTPPYPLSQQVNLQAEVAFSSQLNDPNDVLNTDADFVFNDGRTTVSFHKNDEPFYECLKMLKAESDGQDSLLSPACDEGGLVEMIFDGPFGDESYELPVQGDEDTRHRYQIGYFNDPDDAFNDLQTNTALLESPISIGLSRTDEDSYDAETTVTDDALTGASEAVLTDFYGSTFFNNPKSTLNTTVTVGDAHDPNPDSVIAHANDYTSTDYLVDYTSTILYLP